MAGILDFRFSIFEFGFWILDLKWGGGESSPAAN
jgi:hypothetical protein